ncbi:MAG TPA: rhomboid family intramembrane serine protease [Blastocatellia bacterium]|nr:rhomboid family intramembrane serine protease [Blastocatellia bacterium]
MATCKECGQEFIPGSGGIGLTPSIPTETCPDCATATEAAFHRLLTEATPRVFITPIIIALNLAVFVAMLAKGVSISSPRSDQLIQWGADYGLQTLNGEWWRLLSSVFVHIGALHLFLNMWCLWSLGRLAERMFGNWVFLAIYLLSGLGGSLASVWWNPLIVSAGASGAVFGVAGGLAAFWYFGKIALPRSIIKRDFASILSFVGYNLFFGFATGIVDNAGHLGGLLVGLALGSLLHRPLPATAIRSRLRISLVCAGAALTLVLVAAFARKTHESLISFERGFLHLKNNLNDRAIEEFNRAIASDPKFALAYRNLGVAYLREENHEQAIDAFKRSLELSLEAEARATAYYDLGLAYQAASRRDEAIDAFKQSLQLYSQDADTHCQLGMLYLSKALYDEAVTHLQQALKLNPDLTEAQISLGETYESLKLYDKAIGVYEEALKRNPSDEKMRQKLSDLRAEKSSGASTRRR